METQLIENQLATPILYMPVYKTPEGKYFIDDNQIYRKPTHSVKTRKFDTFVAMAKLTTSTVNLICEPRQLANLNIIDEQPDKIHSKALNKCCTRLNNSKLTKKRKEIRQC